MTSDLTFGQQSIHRPERDTEEQVAENDIQVTVYDTDKGQRHKQLAA